MMATPSNGPLRIGFLPFYVNYYEGICADFPREKKVLAERCARILAGFGEVIWDGQLIGDTARATSVGKRLARQKIDCVVVVTTIAVFGGICWKSLRHLNKPILVWNAQQIRHVGKNYSMVEIVRNTGQIGTQALTNTLLRQGRRYRVVTGYEKSKQTQTDLARFFRLASTVTAVRNARLLDVGGCFPLMSDIAVDEEDLAKHPGPRVVHVEANGLNRAYDRVPKSQVANHIRRLKRSHRVRDITSEETTRSVQLCEAFAALVEKYQADAGTLNCHGACLKNPKIGITGCYSLGVQNAAGRPFTCTGDLPTAVAMLLLKRLTGTAMYTEVQVMDEQRRAIVIANSGEGEDGIRSKRFKSSVVGNTNFTGVHGRGASFAYPLASGPATIVSLTPTPKSRRPYRLVVAEGRILEDRLPDTGSLAGFFQFKQGDMHTAYTRWLEAGPVHHAATTPGHWSDELADVADLLEIEFCKV